MSASMYSLQCPLLHARFRAPSIVCPLFVCLLLCVRFLCACFVSSPVLSDARLQHFQRVPDLSAVRCISLADVTSGGLLFPLFDAKIVQQIDIVKFQPLQMLKIS